MIDRYLDLCIERDEYERAGLDVTDIKYLMRLERGEKVGVQMFLPEDITDAVAAIIARYTSTGIDLGHSVIALVDTPQPFMDALYAQGVFSQIYED